MKKLLIILFLAPISALALFQGSLSLIHTNIVKDSTSNRYIAVREQSGIHKNLLHLDQYSKKCKTAQTNPFVFDHKTCFRDSSVNNIKNISVSRNPEQVVITKDDQFVFISCFLGNAVDIVRISTGEIVKHDTIPFPSYLSVLHNGTEIIVASFTETYAASTPPPDDCSMLIIPCTGRSILTTIDAASQEIKRTDTIKIMTIRKILKSSNDSIIYLVGEDVVEFNLSSHAINRRWQPQHQILESEIDNKNKRIFLTVLDSISDSTLAFSLKAIDLVNGNIFSVSLNYTQTGGGFPFYIGMDTLSNRVFVQGQFQPFTQVLVFDAITLNQLNTIDSASLIFDCFFPCPNLGTIFIGGGYLVNTLELDYSTLKIKNIMLSPFTYEWRNIIINGANTKLYSFQHGAGEESGAQMHPDQYLDVVEYDLMTGNIRQYLTTNYKYGCSYTRTLASTNDGHYLIATNSPENTVSLIDLSLEDVPEVNGNNSIEIYPNPTYGVFTVSIYDLAEEYNIEVYSILGVLLFKTSKPKSEKDFKIDLTKYPQGQYFLRIMSVNQYFVCKVVKK